MYLDYQSISELTTSVKNASGEVQAAKVALQAAELKAVYGNNITAKVMDNVFNSVCEEIAAKFDEDKRRNVITTLKNIAKNGGKYYYNFTNKAAVTLDTEARVKSFSDALYKQYVRTQKIAKEIKERKGVEAKVREKYTALGTMLEGEELVNAVAGVCKVTTQRVKEIIG